MFFLAFHFLKNLVKITILVAFMGEITQCTMELREKSGQSLNHGLIHLKSLNGPFFEPVMTTRVPTRASLGSSRFRVVMLDFAEKKVQKKATFKKSPLAQSVRVRIP